MNAPDKSRPAATLASIEPWINGQLVILNHGDGYYTLYGHLSSISVSVGNEVASGQTVGRSGETGSLKGPVLHFEVRKGGQSLNPLQWLQ